jgi:hypothetical protein
MRPEDCRLHPIYTGAESRKEWRAAIRKDHESSFQVICPRIRMETVKDRNYDSSSEIGSCGSSMIRTGRPTDVE